MNKLNGIFLASAITGLALLTGCAHGTHVVTGSSHPAISQDAVQLYRVAPSRYEVVGLVTGQARGNGQELMNRATAAIKKQAAKMGANGVVLDAPQRNGLAGRKLNLSGQAIYVPPSRD